MSTVAVGISVDEAERITEQIVGRIDSISENVDAVMLLMREALARNAHSALGYASPGAYISDRFGNAMSGLSASLRREFVHELSEAGMSTRAIAPVFGVSDITVRRDIAAGATYVAGDNQVVTSQVSSIGQALPALSPERVPVMSAEEVQRQMVAAGTLDAETGEILDLPATVAPTVTEHTVTEKVKTVTGLDGKTYTRSEPKPRPEVVRGDAAEQENAEQASKALGKALITLSGMKFEAHRERMITRWWPMGNDAVPPDWKALFEPTAIREIAGWLTQLADEMEISK